MVDRQFHDWQQVRPQQAVALAAFCAHTDALRNLPDTHLRSGHQRTSSGHKNRHRGSDKLMDRSANYLKRLVGASGFEPETSCAQGSCKKSILLVRLALFRVMVLGSGPSLEAIGPKLDPSFGLNPCYETRDWAHVQIFIQPSLHLVRGEGVWGR